MNKHRSKSQPPNSMNLDDDDNHVENGQKLTKNSPNIGIIQLSFAYLFEQIKRRKNRDQTLLYIITVSYLEVYNEQVNHFFIIYNFLIQKIINESK